jgi:hypothetical protein
MLKVKGLESTSSLIVISGGVAEDAPNTFTQNQFDLQLNPLDNEVFVVTAIDINLTPPDGDIANNTNSTFGSLSTTTRTGLATLAQSSCLVEARDSIVNDAANGVYQGTFVRTAGETPAADLPYLGIIATNDFFGQVQGSGNKNAKGFTFRMWGYRARASSSVYAALVQSEILSS